MNFFKSNTFLVFISISITLIFLELLLSFNYRKIDKSHNISYSHQRYMLFEQGDVFKNVGKIFKYYPNKSILSETFYKVENEFIKEYSYTITTNNFGLVQKNDIYKDKKSILFLGDSITEGQGAEPWIDYFNGTFNNHQIINGGILGTGLQQFELMEYHISKNFNIDKVFLLYIGDDFRREIFNMSKNTQNCLKNYYECVGDENFYGFPLKEKNPSEFLIKLENFRLNYIQKVPKFKKARRYVKKKLSDLYVVKIPLNFLRIKFYKSKNIKIKKNIESINRLNNKYDKNIFYIQLLYKPEIIEGKTYETIYAQNFIKKISNNHFTCNFNNNLNYYYKIDAHPNKTGYKYLYECVKKIMENNL